MDPELRERLLHRAFLYDDPSAFTAGVDAAMEEFARLMASQAAAQTVGAMPSAETAGIETSRAAS